MHLVVIGVPFVPHKHQSGAGAAPAAWQEAGLAERLARLVTRAVWVSLPPPSGNGTAEEQLVAIGRQLRETVRTVHAAGALPLVLGGDSALCALGTVAGLQHAGEKPGIAWFDAHSSFAPLEPLALLAGRGETALTRGTEVRTVPEWQILLAGTREVSPEIEAVLDNSAATLWGARELRLAGANELGRDAAEWPSTYLHLDLDVLDPAPMPEVASSISGGLALETVIAGIESIAAASQVNALGITGFDPDRDGDSRELITSMQVIEAAIRILVV